MQRKYQAMLKTEPAIMRKVAWKDHAHLVEETGHHLTQGAVDEGADRHPTQEAMGEGAGQ